MRERLVIDARFSGPPGTGNGGYVAGRLAASFDGPVEVSLRRAVPLEKELTVEREGAIVRLRDGDVEDRKSVV